jgi:hypothetical protein
VSVEHAPTELGVPEIGARGDRVPSPLSSKKLETVYPSISIERAGSDDDVTV